MLSQNSRNDFRITLERNVDQTEFCIFTDIFSVNVGNRTDARVSVFYPGFFLA